MTNQMNEVHGRIQARQRNHARGGRHMFAEARKAKEAQSVDPQSFERVSDTNDAAFFNMRRMFIAALDLGLNPLIEMRRGQSLFRVTCKADEWQKILGAGK
jgi:hypothetical protein